jgi:hypothetical protein
MPGPRRSYAWSHLVSQLPEDDDDTIIDVSEAKQIQTKLAETQETLTKSQTDFGSLEKISRQSVDKLEAEIDSLRAKIKELESSTTPQNLDELSYVMLTQKVIAHTRQLSPAETRQKILVGVRTWLTQRGKILNYMNEHKLNLNLVDKVQCLLQLDKNTIISHLENVIGSTEDDSAAISKIPELRSIASVQPQTPLRSQVPLLRSTASQVPLLRSTASQVPPLRSTNPVLQSAVNLEDSP